MINWKNVTLVAGLALLAACDSTKKDCGDPCAIKPCCPDASEESACDFINKVGDRVLFEFDSSKLTPEAQDALKQQACWLQKNKCKKILIEGRCDERGTREYNLGLGERRAQAVANFFKENGICGDRITVVSYGKDRPIMAAEGSSKAEFWKINRVAITVVD